MTTLKVLSSDTIRLIGSTQVITSVSSVVKELIENSLDAGATSIDIKLENYGLDRIEIKDNGKGIPENDIPYLAKRHYTSKISAFTDLEQLLTYGFRGEALASLCAVSEVTVTTRTAVDTVARCLLLNNTGDVISTKLSPQPEGTTICAAKLFKNLPVRQQYNRNDKRRKEELKKVENLVTAFGIINPKVRFTLRHNKDMLWQKAAVDTIRSAVLTAWGYSVVQLLEHVQQTRDDPQVSVEMFLPKCGSDVMTMSKTGGDQGFVYVNKRPVIFKNIQKVIRQYYCSCHSCDTNRYPLFVASISLPQNEVDINLDPNKTQVLMHNDDIVMDVITILLENNYGPLGSVPGRKQVCESKADKTHDSDITDNMKDTRQMPNNTDAKCASDDLCPSKSGLLPNSTESKLESPNDIFRQESSEMNYTHDLDKCHQSSLASKPGRTQDPSLSSCEKPSLSSLNSTDNNFLLELSANSVDQLPESNFLNDSKKASAASKPRMDLDIGADLNPESQRRESEVPNDTCSSDLFDQLVGSFTPETPVVADPTLAEKAVPTQPLSFLEDSRRAADFLDSFNEPVDGETWSRGKMKSKDGDLVQPVQLFAPTARHTPGKRPPSPSHDSQLTPVAKKKAVEPKINIMEGQTTLYDLVESQPVKRPETSFLIFSKQIRPKIMEENPDADYKTLSELIVKKWKSLTDVEKAEFKNLCQKDVKRYEEQMLLAKERAANKILNTKTKVSAKVKPGHTPAREKLLKTCKVSIQAPNKQRPVKVQTVPFSMSHLKEKLSCEYNSSSQYSWTTADRLVPIGYLPSRDAWVCHQGVKLALLNSHRVDEVLIYQRLMESFQVLADPLENPILLNDKLPGGERIWKTLMSLKRENHATSSHQVVADERLLANGFRVAIYDDKSNLSEASQVEVTGLTSCVPMYGIKDLHEVLENIATIGLSTSLMQCRPLKIVNYLKSEAVRMARNSPSFSSRDDIMDLLDRVGKARKWKCLHDRPFLHDIYNLSDLPFSQESVMESQQSIG